jgi:hypothetical protein
LEGTQRTDARLEAVSGLDRRRPPDYVNGIFTALTRFIFKQGRSAMSKLKSIMQNRTQGHLSDQRRSCFDCVHVLPAWNSSEVTCEVYTFKYTRYNVRKKSAVPPAFANECTFFQAMTPEEKEASERKFREFYKRLK